MYYLGHEIQTELILLMLSEIRKKIIHNIRKAKYYSVIMDCTPYINHNDMSLNPEIQE